MDANRDDWCRVGLGFDTQGWSFNKQILKLIIHPGIASYTYYTMIESIIELVQCAWGKRGYSLSHSLT